MATVEELRARLLGFDKCYDTDEEGNSIEAGVVPHCIGIKAEEVDSLIAAAEARGMEKGRQEGAEQEAAKIVHCGECLSATPYPDGLMVECQFGCDRTIDGFCSLGTVLAPDKEEKP